MQIQFVVDAIEAMSIPDEMVWEKALEILEQEALCTELFAGSTFDRLKKTIDAHVLPIVKRILIGINEAIQNGSLQSFAYIELKKYEISNLALNKSSLFKDYFESMQIEGFGGQATARIVILVAAFDALSKAQVNTSGLEALSHSDWIMIILATLRIHKDLFDVLTSRVVSSPSSKR